MGSWIALTRRRWKGGSFGVVGRWFESANFLFVTRTQNNTIPLSSYSKGVMVPQKSLPWYSQGKQCKSVKHERNKRVKSVHFLVLLFFTQRFASRYFTIFWIFWSKRCKNRNAFFGVRRMKLFFALALLWPCPPDWQKNSIPCIYVSHHAFCFLVGQLKQNIIIFIQVFFSLENPKFPIEKKLVGFG